MALKQLKALTTIHLTVAPGSPPDKAKGIAAIPPKVKEIPSGAMFKAMSEEQEQELLDMDAAREMEKEEIKDAAETDVVIDTSKVAEDAKKSSKAKSDNSKDLV